MPSPPRPAALRAPFDPQVTLARLAAAGPGRLTHVEHVAARPAQLARWPEWVAAPVLSAFVGAGVDQLWSHQAEVAEHAYAGRDVVVSTGTASGKSLGYLLPALSAVVRGAEAAAGRGATVLYLAPTKALGADQRDRIERLAIPGVRVATYDGDTPSDERRWIRDHANVVLTNPDLVHYSLLPQHDRWASFLRALAFVVVDECHVYRGVFGSHVAAVLRRLRRVSARYRSAPVHVLASATVGDPGRHAELLVGLPFVTVSSDGSPRGASTFGFWEPGPLRGGTLGTALPEGADGADGTDGAVGASAEADGADGADGASAGAPDPPDPPEPPDAPDPHPAGETPARRSATTESADLLARLVAEDVQTVAFARSRAGVEALASSARRRLEVLAPTARGSVAAYRGGYLPEERRELESAIRSRSLVGLAATNALELGVDITGLDAVVMAGWPGRRSSFWQQAGRAGRAGTDALALFVAADDPLDSYLLAHPETVFQAPVEQAVLDPYNPRVLGPHLAAAAAELPLTDADLGLFGPTAPELVDQLVGRGILRRRPTGWYWARPDNPTDHVSLRGAGTVVSVVEQSTGRVIGTIDAAAAHGQVHTGAVHVHQGAAYVVTDLDLDACTASVVRGDPGWTTHAQSTSTFAIDAVERSMRWGPVRICFGRVRVTGRVTGFLRRLPGGEVIGRHPLDLPERTLPTRAVWWTTPSEDLLTAGIDEAAIPGAAHAAEHAAIGLLPLLATSDRWDVGGVSTRAHPDTGLPTILVYDGYPGGAGFAARAFESYASWIAATRDAVAGCRCQAGCPGCVQSPKCGNGNQPLDKPGAVALLDLVLSHAPGTARPAIERASHAARVSGATSPQVSG